MDPTKLYNVYYKTVHVMYTSGVNDLGHVRSGPDVPKSGQKTDKWT